MLRPYDGHSREVAGLHAAYLVATGAWSLHRASFEALTGRKTDYWLVRTVGGLAMACGLALGASVLRGRRSPETQLLAGAQALVFIGADLHAARSSPACIWEMSPCRWRACLRGFCPGTRNHFDPSSLGGPASFQRARRFASEPSWSGPVLTCRSATSARIRFRAQLVD